MSVVIAIKDNNKIYMAADTMVTLGDTKRHLETESSQKIWAIEDMPNGIMGGAGYLRDINLIRYCTEDLIPEVLRIKDQVDIRAIMRNTVPVIADTIHQYSSIVDGDDSIKQLASSFLLAYKDRCFHIMPDGCVEEVETWDAIGSGAEAALTSLRHTKGQPIFDRLLQALEAASDMSTYVAPPYVCIDTEDCELYDLSYEEDNEEDEDNWLEVDVDDEDNSTEIDYEPVE